MQHLASAKDIECDDIEVWVNSGCQDSGIE